MMRNAWVLILGLRVLPMGVTRGLWKQIGNPLMMRNAKWAGPDTLRTGFSRYVTMALGENRKIHYDAQWVVPDTSVAFFFADECYWGIGGIGTPH